MDEDRAISRRAVLAGGLAAATLAGCGGGSSKATPASTSASETPASSATVPPPPTSEAGGSPAEFVSTGPAGSNGVALTCHTNGDPALCNALFDDAKRLQVPLTFFIVGSWLADHAATGTRLLADGHELANHTYTHPSLGQLGAAAVANEITRCRDELASVLGRPSRWFRPSGIDAPTPLILEEAGKAGYGTCVGFDIDPLDYQDPGATAVEDRVAQRLHPGAIVSLHTSHQGTLDAFADIVASIRQAGLRPVTVSQLFGVA
jgi:peptidoglycan/xylan/chitin deacetylase (PgdA/CDA1 family)